MDAESKNLPQK